MFVKAGLLILAAFGCAHAAAAPDLNLKDARGHNVSLARLRGKVVIVDFWATWCHGCKAEIPWFKEFARRYHRKGLEIIGVSMDEDGWKAVKPFARATRFNYPIVLGNDSAAAQFKVADTLPVTILIDRQGNIVSTATGVIDRAAWETRIRTLLGGLTEN